MSTTCSVASFKQTSNHSNLTNNTNGFCTNLNQTVAASLSDRPRLTQAPKSMAMLGKAVPFIFSRTVPLEESIKEKFRNLHNATILSDTSHILGAQRGVNMIEDYSCPACKRRVTAEHRELVLKAPPILTLHLLRFVGDSKNNSYIRFPLTFDFRPYMASRNGKSLNYQLYAMIIHEGAETAFGHYVACTNRRGVWYEISDAIVTHIDVQQVLAKKPYILFYKLVNPEDTLCFPENTENIKKQVLAAAAKSNSSSPQISNNSFSQKFIFPWRSPSHAPSVINSSNSAAQFPSVTPQPAASKLNPNMPLLRQSAPTLPCVGSSLKRSHSDSISVVPRKTQKFDLYDSGRRYQRSWSEKRFRDKRKHHGHHHRHSHKHKEKRRH
ncbi:unnamed protein product [Hymenolepis diminuta]|uniref:ubiquitinyl hydrolase 1 n=1 Tax=Hymenolepis diminuta TaxID=6216 RepID=A0A0R3SEK6_HYMDI|nr:unnamed protein product [Hymenolepis diminuta]